MSIKVLAERLGLSVSTVSRALNDYPDIAAPTKRRVHEAARHLGYRLSPRRSHEGLKRHYTVGVVLPMQDNWLIDPALSQVLQALAEALAQEQYLMQVVSIPSGEGALGFFEQVIKSGQYDALLLVRTSVNDPRINRLLRLDLPFVCYGRSREAERFAWLDLDNHAAMTMVMERLLSLGHRRFVYLDVDEPWCFARDRKQGMTDTLARYGVDSADVQWLTLPCAQEAASHAVSHWLEQVKQSASLKEVPTAIVGCCDRLAIGAQQAVIRQGLRPGIDISVVGCGNALESTLGEPALTTAQGESAATVGKQLAALLLSRIAGVPATQLQQLMTPQLVVRGSDGPAPLSSDRAQRKINAREQP